MAIQLVERIFESRLNRNGFTVIELVEDNRVIIKQRTPDELELLNERVPNNKRWLVRIEVNIDEYDV